MDSTPSAVDGQEPVGTGVREPRVAVVLGDAPTACGPCRVEAPDRVLRVFTLLNAAADEFRHAAVPPETAARVQRQLDGATAELERSVSPALVGEMHRLLGAGGTGTPTAAELRVRYASLLGWTSGLVVGMLDEVEHAAVTGAAAHVRLVPGRLPRHGS